MKKVFLEIEKTEEEEDVEKSEPKTYNLNY